MDFEVAPKVVTTQKAVAIELDISDTKIKSTESRKAYTWGYPFPARHPDLG